MVRESVREKKRYLSLLGYLIEPGLMSGSNWVTIWFMSGWMCNIS